MAVEPKRQRPSVRPAARWARRMCGQLHARRLGIRRPGPTNRLDGHFVRVAGRGLASQGQIQKTPVVNQLERESPMSEEAFIYEDLRTPRGKQRNGSLNEVKPLNLVVVLVEEVG